MKFNLTFDKDVFVRQQELFIDLAWNTNAKKYNSITISIILIVLGYFSLGYGMHSLIVHLNYFHKRKKGKFKFLKTVNDEADRYLTKGNEMILEFNDESFYYKGFDYESKINWDTFKGFRIIDPNIFMDLNVGNTVSYIISESQVGKEKFDEIIKFLKKKIKHNGQN